MIIYNMSVMADNSCIFQYTKRRKLYAENHVNFPHTPASKTGIDELSFKIVYAFDSALTESCRVEIDCTRRTYLPWLSSSKKLIALKKSQRAFYNKYIREANTTCKNTCNLSGRMTLVSSSRKPGY